MCLMISIETTEKLIRENPDKLTVYKYLYETRYGELHSIFYPYKWKPGINYASDNLPVYKSQEDKQYKGFHFFLTKERAKEEAWKIYRVVRCKVLMKDFIAAGVWNEWERSNKEKKNYQAVFASYYVSKHEYNEALK